MKNFIPNFNQFRLLVIVFSLLCGTAISSWAQISITNIFPSSGPVNRTVTIDGGGMLGVNSVKFNGVSATITSVSASEVKVTVPVGATSGKISVSNGSNTVFSASDFTVYVTWVGGNSFDSWDDGANWSNLEVPDATTNVMIENGGQPVVNDIAVCNKLDLINSSLKINQTNSNLMVYGDFSMAGSGFSHTAGTITFAGNTQRIPALTYFNVIISGNGVKELQGSASVNNLTFIGNGNNLITKIPSTTTLILNGNIAGETPSSNFIGKLEKSRPVTGAGSDDFGNIGISFDNTGSGDWGTVKATRVTGTALVNGSYQSIKRYWDISPSKTPSNSPVLLSLTWFNSENNNLTFPNNKAQAWRSEDDGDTWIPVDISKTIAVNGAERTITVQTNTFSKWGVSDENNPLPVSWLYFKGKATANGNLLSWATASEKNSESFVVERSANGKTFEAIGSVKAAGNSNQALIYSFTDMLPAAGKTYYRLKQNDMNGAFSYSSMILVAETAKGRSVEASVYPNPFAETLNLKLQAADAVKEVRMLTLEGNEVYRKTLAAGADVALTNLPALKPGMYLLQLHGANGITTFKVARQ